MTNQLNCYGYHTNHAFPFLFCNTFLFKIIKLLFSPSHIKSTPIIVVPIKTDQKIDGFIRFIFSLHNQMKVHSKSSLDQLNIGSRRNAIDEMITIVANFLRVDFFFLIFLQTEAEKSIILMIPAGKVWTFDYG